MQASVDRRNGLLFLVANLLRYFAAPVFYVGITQAAFCNKLGASATVANLPATAFAMGYFSPLVVSSLWSRRWDQRILVSASWLSCVLMALICSVLLLPLGREVYIGAMIGESFVLGILQTVYSNYVYQCLGRGTSARGRARALQLAYGFGPVAAVAGSLLAQFILSGGIRALVFPRDFAAVHFIALLCAGGIAWCTSRFQLAPMPDEAPSPFAATIRDGFRRFFGSRILVTLLFAYILWYCSLMAMPNLSLYIKRMGRDPAAYSGWMLAIRFGSKAIFGFLLGLINFRYGFRGPLIWLVALLGAGILWGWAVPGILYLFCFGLMGAGELGGPYFANAVLSLSSPRNAAQNLAFLSCFVPLASLFPAIYGAMADRWGFAASFALAIAVVLVALGAVLRLPASRLEPVVPPAGLALGEEA